MSLEEKIQVNPYLYILLLHMLYYEVAQLDENFNPAVNKLPTNHTIADFILERIKRKNLKEGQEDKVAFNKKETIRTRLLPFKESVFNRGDLDLLVQQVTLLDTFNCWEDFKQKYNSDFGANEAERKYNGLNFSSMSKKIRERIEFWVTRIILDLADYKFVHEEDLENEVFLSSKFFSIRTAKWNEINTFFKEHKIFNEPNSQTRIYNLELMYNKNNYICLVYKTSIGIVSILFLLPLTDNAYEEYITCDLKNSEINHFSIRKQGDLNGVQNLCINICMDFSKDFRKYLRLCFNKVILNLSNSDTIKLITVGTISNYVTTLYEWDFDIIVFPKSEEYFLKKYKNNALRSFFYEKVVAISSKL